MTQCTKFCLSHFPERHEPTFDDTIHKPAEIDGQPYNINIIDTAGQEKYATPTEQWIGQGEAFIMVYNVASRESFTHLQHYYEQIRAIQLSFDTHSVKPEAIVSTTSRSVPLILVGNKSDLQDQRAISTDQGVHLAGELGCKYIETSAKEDANVEEAFIEAVRTNRRQQEAVGHRLLNEAGRDPACRRHKCSVL